MADPISVFPLFVRDQAFPPTATDGGVPVTVGIEQLAVGVATPAVLVSFDGDPVVTVGAAAVAVDVSPPAVIVDVEGSL